MNESTQLLVFVGLVYLAGCACTVVVAPLALRLRGFVAWMASYAIHATAYALHVAFLATWSVAARVAGWVWRGGLAEPTLWMVRQARKASLRAFDLGEWVWLVMVRRGRRFLRFCWGMVTAFPLGLKVLGWELGLCGLPQELRDAAQPAPAPDTNAPDTNVVPVEEAVQAPPDPNTVVLEVEATPVNEPNGAFTA